MVFKGPFQTISQPFLWSKPLHGCREQVLKAAADTPKMAIHNNLTKRCVFVVPSDDEICGELASSRLDMLTRNFREDILLY